jgi:GMP synthase (glutamine-hydrolysing)
MTTPIIAIIDNSINHLSLNTLNFFAQRTKLRYTYHIPSFYGIESLEELNQIDGMVILGSNSYVSDRLDWQKALAEFVVKHIEKNIPSLGICFGHQLIADAYGAKVDYVTTPEDHYSGARTVHFDRDALGFSAGESVVLGYAHRQEVKTLPQDFIALAHSDVCKYEILKHKKFPYWSTQGHPEADRGFMQRTMSPVPSPEDQQKIISGGDKILKGFLSCYADHL